MAIKIPRREFLTFDELLERWQCSANDVRHLIINAELKPSIKALQPWTIVEWDYDQKSDQVLPISDAIDASTGDTIEVKPDGWPYLQEPWQTGLFDCSFSLTSNARDPDRPNLETGATVATWYRLQTTVSLNFVENSAVFLLEEVLRYESAHDGESNGQGSIDRPLETRERNTLLTIIAALCKDAKIDITKPSKAGEYIHSITNHMGATVAKRTIEEHLKKIPNALEGRMK